MTAVWSHIWGRIWGRIWVHIWGHIWSDKLCDSEPLSTTARWTSSRACRLGNTPSVWLSGTCQPLPFGASSRRDCREPARDSCAPPAPFHKKCMVHHGSSHARLIVWFAPNVVAAVTLLHMFKRTPKRSSTLISFTTKIIPWRTIT